MVSWTPDYHTWYLPDVKSKARDFTPTLSFLISTMGLTFSAPFGSAGNHEAGKRSQKTNAVGFHSYEVPRGVKLERQTVK